MKHFYNIHHAPGIEMFIDVSNVINVQRCTLSNSLQFTCHLDRKKDSFCVIISINYKRVQFTKAHNTPIIMIYVVYKGLWFQRLGSVNAWNMSLLNKVK